MIPLPRTLGELKEDSRFPSSFRSIKDEIRSNLLARLAAGGDLFEGIVGYDETVIPGLVNALLSRHDFILLGLRGQAKSRILRQLTSLLDENLPYIEGSEIHDDPFNPISPTCRRRLEEEGDAVPIRFLSREKRFIEKLATPDVTIADVIGDLDPIKAARHGAALSAFESVHLGLLPRAHRCIFAINELPDLAPKIQVGLFNILQEGDVQIKGFPLRLPLDLLIAFTANPEDYTARGKIITPLKDRIGAEIRTHYPLDLRDGLQITRQEAWTKRSGDRMATIPAFVESVIERIAILGRRDDRIDQRSGVSQRLPISCTEFALSNAERRAVVNDEKEVVVRLGDVHAALPTITGKLELEYEGELHGAGKVAAELIRSAVLETFGEGLAGIDFEQIVQWFDLGGEVRIGDQTGSAELYEKVRAIQGLDKPLERLGIGRSASLPLQVSAIEYVLEGLSAQKRISRDNQRGFFHEPPVLDDEIMERFKDREGSFN